LFLAADKALRRIAVASAGTGSLLLFSRFLHHAFCATVMRDGGYLSAILFLIAPAFVDSFFEVCFFAGTTFALTNPAD